MRKTKPFLVICTACILMCSIPINACALSPFDSELDYYTYNHANVSTAYSPWYNVNVDGNQYVGKVHCRNGSIYGCFILFIPFMGYYLVVRQSGDLPVDGTVQNGNRKYIYYATATVGSYSPNKILTYSGNGTYSSDNHSLFQAVILSEIWVFVNIKTNSSGDYDRGYTSSISNGVSLNQSELDALRQLLSQYINNGGMPTGADNIYIFNSSTPTSTAPNGEPITTDPWGNPVPTDINGNPVTTNSVGNPVPTYPNGRPRETFPNGSPVPTDSAGNALPTFTTPDGSTYVDPEGYTHVTNPDNGEPVTTPDTHLPVYEEVTIYNDENGKSDVNEEFSKIHSLIADLDDISSIMESNQDDLSDVVGNTRNLVDDILSWFPAPIIACMVCGFIMIIAVKITGSGKS